MSFQLYYHPGTQPWRMDPDLVQRISTWYRNHGGRPVAVHVWPRSKQGEITPDLQAPYTYRAITKEDGAHLLADATETSESLAWLLMHELGHQVIRTSPIVKEALKEGRPREKTLHTADDRYHQIDPEERLVDGFATALIGKRLDRDWWRKRTLPKFGGDTPGPTRFGHCC